MFNEDLNKICRLCLKQEGEMSPIFERSEHETENAVLLKRITSIAPIQINPEDGLPTMICRLCREQVDKFYDFRLLVEISDSTLRACLMNTSQLELYEPKVKVELIEDVEYVQPDLTDNKLISMNTLFVPLDSSVQVWNICNTNEDYAIQVENSCNINQIISNDSRTLNCSKERRDIKESDDLKKIHCSLGEEFLECNQLSIDKSFICVYCNESFHANKDLSTHLKNHEQEEAEYLRSFNEISCELCFQVFEHLSDLKSHISEHFVINKKNISSTKHKMHISVKDEVGNFTEDIYIPEKYKKKDDKSLDSNFLCAECHCSFSTNDEYILHVKEHTSARIFKCKFCDETFTKITYCKYHEEGHLREKRYICLECGKSFFKRSELRYHKGIHVKTPPVCPVCNKYFQNIQSYKIHMKRHTLGSRYICEICGKSYYTNSELVRHAQMHSGKREHPCQLCEMSFFSKPELNRHLKYHTGEKRFKCSVCFKSYFESGHLKIHERVHTGERPFICAVCSKSFISRSKLMRHQKIHDKN